MVSLPPHAAAFAGRSEGNLIDLMPRLPAALLMTFALAGCSTAGPAVPGAGSMAAITAGPAWRAEVLAVVLPLADRRLATSHRRGPGADAPLLPLGLDALGRASGEPRYAVAANEVWAMQVDQRPLSLNGLCAESVCRAADLLERPALWADPGEVDRGGAGVARLEPSFRRMAATLFDREALLFHNDQSTTGQSRFDARLNATAFAALTRMVDALPAEDPARLEYVALYREMARAVTRVQGRDGWWRETLGEEAGPVDRSASALFVFGLTWGLNTGMLSFNEGETAALTGWVALRTPADLESLEADDAGLGALMLAAAQMAERQW